MCIWSVRKWPGPVHVICLWDPEDESCLKWQVWSSKTTIHIMGLWKHSVRFFHTLPVLCRLNLPTCLPDVYIHLKDPQPVSRKKYTAVNREHLCKGINCVEVDSDPHIDLHAWYWVLLQVSCTFVQCKQQTKVVVLELMLNVGQFPVWICMYDCKATTQLPKTTVWLPLIDLSACFPFAAYAVQS